MIRRINIHLYIFNASFCAISDNLNIMLDVTILNDVSGGVDF